jgi:hypothetical protein
MKICNKCGIEKECNEFYKHKRYKDGLEANCKFCKKLYQFENKETIQKNKQIYFIENKIRFKEYKEKYKLENPEKVKSYSDKWYNKMEECDKWYNKMKQCDILKDKYRIRKNNYHKYKMSNDLIYRVRNLTTGIISKSFRQNGYSKKSRTNEILGCSFEEFKIHLESKFESWMGWYNRGKYNGDFNYGWDIDHIIPLASAQTEEDIIRLNHYTNLQPLCSKINRDIKRDIIE